MPKKSTPDADLKTEFAELRTIAKEEKALKASLSKVQARKRKTVHLLSTKKNANVASMAAIFGVSRQALAKEIRAHAGPVKSNGTAPKAPAAKAPAKAAAKAPAKKAAPAKAAATKAAVKRVVKAK